jgi:hypothetical protein
LRRPDTRYFLGAPTWSQAKGIFWKRLKADTRFAWRRFPSESELVVTLLNDAEICLFGLDKPERIEGQPWHGGLITEFANVKADAWEGHVRPVLSDTNGFAILESVPEGRNHFYDRCLEAAGGSLPIVEAVVGARGENKKAESSFYGWFSGDVLPKREIDVARRELSEPMFKQEYQASFDNYQGAVYYAFSDENVDADECQYDKDQAVYVGMDLNVDPMTAVLGHLTDSEVLLFKGYFLRNCNTKTLCERICNGYPDTGAFDITPCQSSAARQTVADIGVTDLRIIRSAFEEHGRVANIHRRSKNPRVVDRVNCTNSLLEHKRLKIHPSMKQLRKDWEHLGWKEGTRDLDLKDPQRGHISAACDYLCEFWFPIRPDLTGQTSLDGIIT